MKMGGLRFLGVMMARRWRDDKAARNGGFRSSSINSRGALPVRMRGDLGHCYFSATIAHFNTRFPHQKSIRNCLAHATPTL